MRNTINATNVLEVITEEKAGVLDYFKNYNYNELTGMEQFVVDTVTHHNETSQDTLQFIQNVISYGCNSGIVTELIYTRDIEQVFIRYMNEIFEIYNEEKLSIDNRVEQELTPTLLTYFAYEFTLNKLFQEFLTYYYED